ncbi:MAG: hypothetical protein A2138_03780 [Deltaproteobacteria bacterium RBG_16_71_12]|nr:MAG: hypothetical protein A2138_03780 [Deltaproteobacteria bacterium RBG_16_71_12]
MLALALLLVGDLELQGSAAERLQATVPSEDSLLSTRDQPELLSLSELNAQVRGGLLDDRLRLGIDASAFLPVQGGYADRDFDTGQLVEVDPDSVTPPAPFVTLSEWWLSAEPVPHLIVTAGKKRTTWGSGQMASPTDVLNPPRDPTDPSLQRAGFLQLRADAAFESWTLSALFAPYVLESVDGLPAEVLLDDDDELHYAAALRGYALVLDTDVNAWVIWSERYGDAFENHLRYAFSLSRTIFLEHEVHADVLVEQGSARLYVDPDCVGGTRAIMLCALSGTPIADDALIDSERVLPKILVGWRWMPPDGSMLTAEYLYQADGLVKAEYDDLKEIAVLAGKAQRSGTTGGVELPGVSPSGGDEAPVRVAFAPQRRNYLLLSWLKPQVADDFTLQATAIVPVEDLSMLVSGSVAWQAQEWLTLSVLGFLPVPSPAMLSYRTDDDPLGALYADVPHEWRGWFPRGATVEGGPHGDFDGAPFHARIMIEARAYF